MMSSDAISNKARAVDANFGGDSTQHSAYNSGLHVSVGQLQRIHRGTSGTCKKIMPLVRDIARSIVQELNLTDISHQSILQDPAAFLQAAPHIGKHQRLRR